MAIFFKLWTQVSRHYKIGNLLIGSLEHLAVDILRPRLKIADSVKLFIRQLR